LPLLDHVVFLDLETTGLSPEENVIIEIGAVKVKNGNREEFHQLVNPGGATVPLQVLELCQGLRMEDLHRAPALEQVKEELLVFIEDLPLVCHNAAFEKAFLEKALGKQLNRPILDTLELFCLFKPHFPYHNLDYLAENYLENESREAHRALSDATDTMETIDKLLHELQHEDADLLRKALDLMKGTGWPWLEYLQKLQPSLPLSSQKLKKGRDTGPGQRERETEIKIKHKLKDIPEILHHTHSWEEWFPGYRPKEQQISLAREIAGAFSNSQALFAEAPTGSGKTLAYLLVAVLWAAEHDERVYISTNTRNLQEQINEELPRLARVLGEDNFPAVNIKGVSNYLCRARAEEEINKIIDTGNQKIIEEGAENSKSTGINKEYEIQEKLSCLFLHNWIQRTKTGEIEDIPFWFNKNYPYLQQLLFLVRCSREECFREDCNYFNECFYHSKVEDMHKSRVTVMNHSLLLTWPPHYPEIKKLIIDEAHNLEEKAFDSFTETADSEELKATLQRLSRGKDEGFIHKLLFSYRKINAGANFTRALETVAQIKERITTVTARLKQQASLPNHRSAGGEYNFTAFVQPHWEELYQETTDLAADLEFLATFIKNTLEEMEYHDHSFGDSTLYQTGFSYIRNCRTFAETLQESFRQEREELCRYVELRGGRWKFCLAPLDVSQQFYSRILEEVEAVVLTSATLSEAGSYERIKEALGFHLMENVREIEPGDHVFNYRENCVLAVAADSPGHKSPRFVDYIARAVDKIAVFLGGRTMVLFSSNQRMREVAQRVEAGLEKEGIITLSAHQHSRHYMARQMRQNPNTVLLGSRSFFEGVDISGPALSCIIIDKLPFPYPGEPLHQSREHYLFAQGKNPFQELSLSYMLRTFRQQFGRLIRSEEDQGFVVVLGQLGTRSPYFNLIKNELPPVEVVEKSLDKIIEEMEAHFRAWNMPTVEPNRRGM